MRTRIVCKCITYNIYKMCALLILSVFLVKDKYEEKMKQEKDE